MSWIVIRECRSVIEDFNIGYWLRDNGIFICVYINVVVCVGRKIIKIFLIELKDMYLERNFLV